MTNWGPRKKSSSKWPWSLQWLWTNFSASTQLCIYKKTFVDIYVRSAIYVISFMYVTHSGDTFLMTLSIISVIITRQRFTCKNGHKILYISSDSDRHRDIGYTHAITHLKKIQDIDVFQIAMGEHKVCYIYEIKFEIFSNVFNIYNLIANLDAIPDTIQYLWQLKL